MMPLRQQVFPNGVPRKKRERPEETEEGMKNKKKRRSNGSNALGTYLTSLSKGMQSVQNMASSPSLMIQTLNKQIATSIVHVFSQNKKENNSDVAIIMDELIGFESLLFALFMYNNAAYLIFHKHIENKVSGGSSEASNNTQSVSGGASSGSSTGSGSMDTVLNQLGVNNPFKNNNFVLPDMVGELGKLTGENTKQQIMNHITQPVIPKQLEKMIDNVIPSGFKGAVLETLGVKPKSSFQTFTDFVKSVGGFFASPGNTINNGINEVLADPFGGLDTKYTPWPSVVAILLMICCATFCGHLPVIMTWLWKIATGTAGTWGYLFAGLALAMFVAETVRKYSNPITMITTYFTGGFYTLLATLGFKSILVVSIWPQVCAVMVYFHIMYLSMFATVHQEGRHTLKAFQKVAAHIGGKNQEVETAYPDIKKVVDYLGARAPALACTLRFGIGLKNCTKLKTPSLAITLMSVYVLGIAGVTLV